eukprot:4292625-Pyramimonas_sp.AAC.2
MLHMDPTVRRLVAKLCDFGSAELIDWPEGRNGGPGGPAQGEQPEPMAPVRIGTPLWMAPEMLYGHIEGDQTLRGNPAAADVFSYAIVVWEMLTGSLPWVDRFRGQKNVDQQAVVEHVVERVLVSGMRPFIPAWVQPEVHALLIECCVTLVSH